MLMGSRRTSLLSERKGFMHTIEGVIAAMTLLVYFYTTTMPPLQQNDWTHNTFRQSGTEYLEAVERANLSAIMIENSAIFSEITNQIFETSDVSIIKKGLPPDFIRVGIATNHSGENIIYFDSSNWKDNNTCINSYGWTTEFGCIINKTGFGINFTLADTDGNNGFDEIFIYDSIYIDMNSNGKYDYGEGPFFTNSYANINGNPYYVGYIDNSTKSVALWNATPILKYARRSPEININGKNTTLLFYGADISRDISLFDVILISGFVNITPYAGKLQDFLDAGGGIVEVANLTERNYDAVQADLFGLANTSYGVIGNSNEVHTSTEGTFSEEPLKIGNYFSGISMRVLTSPAVYPPYDVSSLPNPSTVRVGLLNVSGRNASIAVANQSLLSYDSLYIDANGDYNFSKPPQDAFRYKEGDSFTLQSGNYTIKKIDPYGTYADIRPAQNATLVNFFNPLRLDSADSWAGAEQENLYSISTNSPGASFIIALLPAPTLGDNATLPFGNHTYGNITLLNSNISGEYNISVTNTSSSVLLNIDMNRDLQYNGYGEGPFSDKELVGIGPEIYLPFIKPDGSSITFQLISRKNVPASSAGDRHSGRTVWMPDITDGGQDSWNYIAASIVWVSQKKGDKSKITGYSDLVSSRKVFVLSNDIYQPFIAELYRGYSS